MLMLEEFETYQTWANSITLGMLRHTHTDLGTKAFAHLLAANLVWGSRLAGTDPECEVAPSWNLAECEKAMARITALYRDLPAQLSEDIVVHYKTSTGVASSSTAGQIMRQLWVHNAYHRGEIAGCIKLQGGTVVDTDYIIFLRSAK